MNHYRGLLATGNQLHDIKASNKAQLESTLKRLAKDPAAHWQIIDGAGKIINEGGYDGK